MNRTASFLNEVAGIWWAWMVPAFWQATGVGLTILALVFAARRWQAPWKHALLLIALAKFAVPPFFYLPTGLFSSISGTPGRETAVFGSFPEAPFLFGKNWHPSEPNLSKGVKTTAGTGERSAVALEPKAVLMLLASAGMLLMIAYIASEWLRLRKHRCEAEAVKHEGTLETLTSLAKELKLKRLPLLLASDKVNSPLAYGVLKPTIILPRILFTKLSYDELRTVLAHEAAHFRRGDFTLNAIQLLILAVWWFHPVCWMIHRATRRAREECCDDLLIVRKLTTREQYCRAILRAAEELIGQESQADLIAARLHPVGGRLVRIMDAKVHRADRLTKGGFIFALGLASLLLPGLQGRQSSPTGPFPVALRISNDPEALLKERAEAGARHRRRTEKTIGIEGEIKALPDLDLFQMVATASWRNSLPFVTEALRRKENLFRILEESFGSASRAAITRSEALIILQRVSGFLGADTVRVLPWLAATLPQDEFAVQSALILGALREQAKSAAPALLAAVWKGNAAAADAFVSVTRTSPEEITKGAELIANPNLTLALRSTLAESFSRYRDIQLSMELEKALLDSLSTADERLQHKTVFALLSLGAKSPQTLSAVSSRFENPVLARQQGECAALSIDQLIQYIRFPRTASEDLDAANELKFRNAEANRCIPALVEMLENERRSNRGAAASALGQMGAQAKNALPALIEFAHSSAWDRRLAYSPLVVIGIANRDSSAILQAAAGLEDPDTEVQQASIRALTMCGLAGGTALVPKLIEVMASGDTDAQFLAASTLWYIDQSQAESIVPVLIQQLQVETHRAAATRILGEIGNRTGTAKAYLEKISGNLDINDRTRGRIREPFDGIRFRRGKPAPENNNPR